MSLLNVASIFRERVFIIKIRPNQLLDGVEAGCYWLQDAVTKIPQ